VSESGRRIEYGHFVAFDSGGQTVPSRLEVTGGSGLRLVVEDDGASYPLVIDPLLSAEGDSILESNQAGVGLGSSVSGAGDVNGDGYDDIIVGAPSYDVGEISQGAAFVFLGSASGIMANGNPNNADSQLESNQAFAQFGWSVSGAGDVNGDGYDDVIGGARLYDTSEFAEGAAFVFLGSDSGIVANGDPIN